MKNFSKKLLTLMLVVFAAVSLMTVASAADNVAQIGESKFDTLAEAVAAVPTNNTETTITLLKDATGSGVKVYADQNIVFDLNGHTYTVSNPTVGSPGTETNGFQLLKGSKVTFKNGALESAQAKSYCRTTAT